MSQKPNILFLMCDQLRGDVFDPDHICKTPNIDRLAARGIRFERAYTPNPVCSPARASLMTGLVPHNHGVLWVTHTIEDDQGSLRTDKPHWAQHLRKGGYNTGYFGKWHVERTDDMNYYGWTTASERDTPEFHSKVASREEIRESLQIVGKTETPGYPDNIIYGVTDIPAERRSIGGVVSMANDFLDDALNGDDPWCCFVSSIEPHDPYIVERSVYEQYPLEDIPLPSTLKDDFADKPNLYKRSREKWEPLTETQHREAAACYFAAVTEIDTLYGTLIDKVEAAGQLDNTIIILTSDHGDFLGAHGIYYKNIGAFEEAYNIPIIAAGPGIAENAVTSARVGLHDLCPTILDLVECETIDVPDSRSFASVMADPAANEGDFTQGYAEYFGGRLMITQRVVWDDNWKYVFNGFDYDELYNLADDPHEAQNLAQNPEYREQLDAMMRLYWNYARKTNDLSLIRTSYTPLRLPHFGPDA